MKKIIRIEGMSCNHCVMAVKKGLEKIAGVTSVSVDLVRKSAVVESAGSLSEGELRKAVEDAGYTVTGIE